MKPYACCTSAAEAVQCRRPSSICISATKLFGQWGIDGTSLTDVAGVAKVPLSSIYDYFEDKRALVLDVPEGNYEALYQKTEPLLVKGGDPVEQLRITAANTTW